MAVNKSTTQQRADAANSAIKVAELLFNNVQSNPVNYSADVDAAVAAAITKLTAIQSAA